MTSAPHLARRAVERQYQDERMAHADLYMPPFTIIREVTHARLLMGGHTEAEQ